MERSPNHDMFRAMNTTIEIRAVGVGDAEAVRAIANVHEAVADWEDRFSRFRPFSMLSEVNDNAGDWTQVDGVFVDVLDQAIVGYLVTNGLFDPGVLQDLEAAGYDDTFEVVGGGARVARGNVAVARASVAQIELDHERHLVRLPVGLRIDLGGIVKGALADHLARRYRHWPGGLISIGGDLRLWGLAPDADAWTVGVENPWSPDETIASIGLPAGKAWSVATSSTVKRSWQSQRGPEHHLIDPETGSPVESPFVSCTVLAKQASTAEIVAKALLCTSARGPLNQRNLLGAKRALLVSASGAVQVLP